MPGAETDTPHPAAESGVSPARHRGVYLVSRVLAGPEREEQEQSLEPAVVTWKGVRPGGRWLRPGTHQVPGHAPPTLACPLVQGSCSS